MTDYFPLTYENSRGRFNQSLELLTSNWPDARLEHHPLSSHPELSMDWMWAEPQKRENLIILSTAEHGIEGYVGSAMQYLFMQEFIPRLNPENTGVLLIHALNPWGMAHFERYNENHVDLNRNFIADGNYDKAYNPDYTQLARLILPRRRIGWVSGETLLFGVNLLVTLARHGSSFIREGTLKGQYRDPQGVYFGGDVRQEETDVMMALLKKAFMGYKSILHLDMHTGYGPRYQMSMVNSPLEPLSSAEAAAKFNYPLVVKTNPEEFYTIKGDMIDYDYHIHETEYPDRELFATSFEFGTFGDSLLAGIRSLRAEVMDNQLSVHGARNETIAAQVRREFKALFYPDEKQWQDKALEDARQAFTGILSAYDLLNP